MRTRLTLLGLLSGALLLLLAAPASAGAPAKDGKSLFTGFKCNLCHSIESQGVAVVQDEEEGEAAEDDGGKKPPDLSNVGAERDVKWLKDWLMKKVEIDGKMHRKKFTGEPAELTTLTTWLATLKKPAAK